MPDRRRPDQVLMLGVMGMQQIAGVQVLSVKS